MKCQKYIAIIFSLVLLSCQTSIKDKTVEAEMKKLKADIAELDEKISTQEEGENPKGETEDPTGLKALAQLDKELRKQEGVSEIEPAIQGFYQAYKATTNNSYDKKSTPLYLVEVIPVKEITYYKVDEHSTEFYNQFLEQNEIGFKTVNFNNEGITWKFSARGSEEMLIITGVNRDYDARLGGSVLPLDDNWNKMLVSTTIRNIGSRLIEGSPRGGPEKTREIWVKK